MNLFFCEDTPEGVLSAIYDVWGKNLKTESLRIEIENNGFQLSLTDTIEKIETNGEKADKVMRTVRKRLNREDFELFEGALLSDEKDRADAIYRFLKMTFSARNKMAWNLNSEEVLRIFELDRKTRREAHHMVEFIRFSALPGGIFFSKIHPKADVLPLIKGHFVERFNTHPFIILDATRMKSLVYYPKEGVIYVDGAIEDRLQGLVEKDEFTDLWKTFFNTVAIQERKNYACQRNLLPLRFRADMTEFSEDPVFF